MSSHQDITNEKLSATKGAVCRNESENQTAHALACDYADLVHHHNERGKARQQKQPEPDTEPDYEVEGLIPHN